MDMKLISILLILGLTLSGQTFATSEQAETSKESVDTLPSGNNWQVIRSVQVGKSEKSVYMVLVNHDFYTDKTVYSNAINRLCRSEKEFCKIRFWSQLQNIPEKLSMKPDQYKQMRAEYTFNKRSGMLKLTWSCTVDPDRTHCLDP